VSPHGGYEERWIDRDAGPVVRPYFLTKGRTSPAGGTSYDLIDVVSTTGVRPPQHFRPGPEHRQILSLCRNPIPIVDLTSEIDLPLGVVRVLLGDLVSEGLVRIHSAKEQPAAGQPLLRMVLDGLESL
jgi:Protein of unknown function (DUF742)